MYKHLQENKNPIEKKDKLPKNENLYIYIYMYVCIKYMNENKERKPRGYKY